MVTLVCVRIYLYVCTHTFTYMYVLCCVSALACVSYTYVLIFDIHIVQQASGLHATFFEKKINIYLFRCCFKQKYLAKTKKFNNYSFEHFYINIWNLLSAWRETFLICVYNEYRCCFECVNIQTTKNTRIDLALTFNSRAFRINNCQNKITKKSGIRIML